jgi:hypothetical protein
VCSDPGGSWLVGGRSSRRLGFNPGPVYVGFVVEIVTLGYVLLKVLRVSPVTVTPRMLHARSFNVSPTLQRLILATGSAVQ